MHSGECAASSQRHELYTVHYLFCKTSLNFHSPQDLKMCVNTAFDFDISKGNPLMRGFPLKRGTVPHMRGPPRGFFSLCITIYRRKNQIQKATMMSMKVHLSSLHAPIYRNFYMCVGKKFEHFDVERPVKVCAPTGLSRAPPPKLSGELSFQAPYDKKKKSGAFPMKHQPCPSCTDVQVDVSMKKKT